MNKRRYAINRIEHTIFRPVYCSSNKIGRSYNYLESYDVVTSQVVHNTHPTQQGRTFLNQVGTSLRISTKRYYQIQYSWNEFSVFSHFGQWGQQGKFLLKYPTLAGSVLCFNGQNNIFFYFLYIVAFTPIDWQLT